jgi:VIT1/CCC1 family predicted Fe2+/Mn2+ transporter
MIIYAGYKYASAVFSGKSPSFSMVKDAIIGVLVIIFSYAIIKALSAAFL